MLDTLSAMAEPDQAEWRVPFSGPPLPSAGRNPDAARAWVEALGFDITERVDFWTEAALFSAAGKDAIVLGPGHIEQAHTVDEWVELSQLEQAEALYRRVIEHD